MASFIALGRLALQPLASGLLSSMQPPGAPKGNNVNFASRARGLDRRFCRWVTQPVCSLTGKPVSATAQGKQAKQGKSSATLGVLLRSCCRRRWEWVTLVSLHAAVVTTFRKDSDTRRALLAALLQARDVPGSPFPWVPSLRQANARRTPLSHLGRSRAVYVFTA